MKRHLLVAVVLLLPSVALASESTAIKRSMAEELLTLTDSENALSSVRDQMIKMLEGQAKAMDLSEEEQASMVKRQQKMFDLVFEELSWKNLKKDYIDIYAAVYTQEELSGLLTFFRSPIGQSFTKKSPELMARMMEVVQKRTQRLTPRLMALIEDEEAEADKEEEEGEPE